MVKTDNRHYNNTSINRNLHTELDLWIAFRNNGEKPILLGRAVGVGKINNMEFSLYYAPADFAKSLPFLVSFKYGAEHDSCRYESISSAKYYIKKACSNAKWQKAIN